MKEITKYQSGYFQNKSLTCGACTRCSFSSTSFTTSLLVNEDGWRQLLYAERTFTCVGVWVCV